MNSTQIATLFALAQKSTNEENTQRLINQLIDVVSDLANELERQQNEIDIMKDLLNKTSDSVLDLLLQ